MAVSFKPVNSDTVQISPIRRKMAASQTIAEGDPVTISSGVVSLAAASCSAIYGFAAEAAESEASGDYYMNIWPAHSDAIFLATASTTISISNIDTATADCYDLAGTTGAFTVNVGATGDDIFRIVDIPGGIEHGTFETAVYVKVSRASSQFHA